MHARWLTEVLGPGDSLFTPSVPVWTSGHLDELERAFVAHPDLTPGKRYEDKLREQIAAVISAAKQLMAELHAVHFLMIWTGAISVATKTRILTTILAWMPAPPELPADVVRAMGPGLVNPGRQAKAAPPEEDGVAARKLGNPTKQINYIRKPCLTGLRKPACLPAVSGLGGALVIPAGAGLVLAKSRP